MTKCPNCDGTGAVPDEPIEQTLVPEDAPHEFTWEKMLEWAEKREGEEEDEVALAKEAGNYPAQPRWHSQVWHEREAVMLSAVAAQLKRMTALEAEHTALHDMLAEMDALYHKGSVSCHWCGKHHTDHRERCELGNLLKKTVREAGEESKDDK